MFERENPKSVPIELKNVPFCWLSSVDMTSSATEGRSDGKNGSESISEMRMEAGSFDEPLLLSP